MQAQRDVIAGFQTLGTGNKYVGNWTKFMYAAGKGAADRVISLPGNIKDAIGGALLLAYDLVTETRATVGQAKAQVTGIAVQAMAIASDPHGTYEKAMDSLTAMGEDGLLSAAGEITGGMAFDYWSGGLAKGMGIGGKAMAMAQETKVGRAIAKGYEEARGAVQSAKTAAKEFGSGFKQGFGQGIKDSLRTASSNPLGPLVQGTEQGIKSAISARNETVDLFRSVGIREFKSVMESGKFLPGANSLEGRQFAYTLKEALKYAETDRAKVAVLKVTVPRDIIQNFDFSKNIDPHIFKNGVITVQSGIQSELFHQNLIGPVIHIF